MEHGCARRLPRAPLTNNLIGTVKLLESCPGAEITYLGLGSNGAKEILWVEELAVNVEIQARLPREFDTAARHEAVLPPQTAARVTSVHRYENVREIVQR